MEHILTTHFDILHAFTLPFLEVKLSMDSMGSLATRLEYEIELNASKSMWFSSTP